MVRYYGHLTQHEQSLHPPEAIPTMTTQDVKRLVHKPERQSWNAPPDNNVGIFRITQKQVAIERGFVKGALVSNNDARKPIKGTIAAYNGGTLENPQVYVRLDDGRRKPCGINGLTILNNNNNTTDVSANPATAKSAGSGTTTEETIENVTVILKRTAPVLPVIKDSNLASKTIPPPELVTSWDQFNNDSLPETPKGDNYSESPTTNSPQVPTDDDESISQLEREFQRLVIKYSIKPGTLFQSTESGVVTYAPMTPQGLSPNLCGFTIRSHQLSESSQTSQPNLTLIASSKDRSGKITPQ